MNAKAELILPDKMERREMRASIPPINDPTGVMALIAAASRDPNVDPDKMLKLYDIRDRELARLARQSFAAAMARFKANPPKIIKDKHVEFTTSKGVTAYDHATLAHVCAQVIEGLAAVEISHRWDLDQREGGMIYVTCVLTHAEGHSTSTTLFNSRDDSGSKNNIQAVGSTVTYLQRYTLLSAVGLAAGEDTDGRTPEDSYERVNERQEADLRALLSEKGKTADGLLTYLNARGGNRKTLADIRADEFDDTVRLVRGRGGK